MAQSTYGSAIVTGGGRGIGRAAALELARRGVPVAVVARTASDIDAVAAEIKRAGGTALALPCDVRDPAAVGAMLDAAQQQLGPVGMLVNNAAIIGPLGSIVEIDPRAWATALEINLLGAFYAARLALPTMLRQDWGRIINVSSGAAQGSGIVRGSAYSVSKAALDMLTRSLAAELDGSRIAVISVYPGVVDTAMQTAIRTTPAEQLGADTSARFQGYYEGGQLLDPSVPGRMIAALCGPTGMAYHGQIVRVSDPAAQQLMADDPR